MSIKMFSNILVEMFEHVTKLFVAARRCIFSEFFKIYTACELFVGCSINDCGYRFHTIATIVFGELISIFGLAINLIDCSI